VVADGDVLIDRRVADVQAALTEYGAAWALQLERDYGEAVRAWLALLDVGAESQSKMAAAESLRGFVRSGRWWAHPTDHGVDGAISTLRGAYAPAVEVEEPTAA
jgi:hypothetical protein